MQASGGLDDLAQSFTACHRIPDTRMSLFLSPQLGLLLVEIRLKNTAGLSR
jgi:hypothetical protein